MTGLDWPGKMKKEWLLHGWVRGSFPLHTHTPQSRLNAPFLPASVSPSALTEVVPPCLPLSPTLELCHAPTGPQNPQSHCIVLSPSFVSTAVACDGPLPSLSTFARLFPRGQPRHMFLAFPNSCFCVLHTWHVTGHVFRVAK